MLLIIDHFDSFSHNLYQLLAGLGHEVLVRRCDEISSDDIQNKYRPEAIILSPGPKGPEDTGVTLELLKSDWAQNQVIIGICLGMQALGLHWEIPTRHAAEVVHGKTIQLHLKTHEIFKDLQGLQVARYHSLCLYEEDTLLKQERVEILSSFEGMVMIAKDRRNPWLGIQFHPESFLTPKGEDLMKNALEYLQS